MAEVTRRTRTQEIEFVCHTGDQVIVTRSGANEITVMDGDPTKDEELFYSLDEARLLADCLREVAGDSLEDKGEQDAPALPAQREVRVGFMYEKNRGRTYRVGVLVGAAVKHLHVVEDGQFKSFSRDRIFDLVILSY